LGAKPRSADARTRLSYAVPRFKQIADFRKQVAERAVAHDKAIVGIEHRDATIRGINRLR